MLRARAVLDREGNLGRERQRLAPVREEHANRRHARRPERRSRVVVGENLLEGRAVLRVAVRAVLAHADSVPPAVTAEDEERTGAGGGREARSRAQRCPACGRGGAHRERGGEGDERQQATDHGRVNVRPCRPGRAEKSS